VLKEINSPNRKDSAKKLNATIPSKSKHTDNKRFFLRGS